MKSTSLAALGGMVVVQLALPSCSSSPAALPQAEFTVLARIEAQKGRVGWCDQLEFVPDVNGDGLPELEHRVVPFSFPILNEDGLWIHPELDDVIVASARRCKLDAGFDWDGDGREDGVLLVQGEMNTMHAEPDQLVVFSRANETVLGHWTDLWFSCACGQVVSGKPRLVVSTNGVLRILLRDGTFEVPVYGTHVTPCPNSLARGTKYEGAVAVARHGEDNNLGPVGSDWIEIIRLKTPPSTRDAGLDRSQLGALTR